MEAPLVWAEIADLRLLLLSAASLDVSYRTFLCSPWDLGELDNGASDCSKDTETCKFIIQALNCS